MDDNKPSEDEVVAPVAAPDESPAAPIRTGRGCLTQVFVAVVIGAAAYGGYLFYEGYQSKEALVAHKQQVRTELTPVVKRMSEVAQSQTQPYDIDKTVRVIHEIDAAIKRSKDLKGYMAELGKQDYRGVAPEVLSARAELLEIILKVYESQMALEDQQAAWELTSEVLLTVLSAVNVNTGSGGLPGALLTGQFSVSQEKLEQALDETKARHEQRRQLQIALREVDQQLLKATLKYSKTYYKYLEEWDRLCIYRDRAYLAMYNQDWEQALAAADEAIKLSPSETEAHLIKAAALIELGQGPEALVQADGAASARQVLKDYIDAHPDRTAPAFLLLGILEAKSGQRSAATLALQQAATYYPKQAQLLQDMLNPYKMREFLRKSREGGLILEQYKSTMLGAGYFSPDLQMARLRFDEGDFEGGRQKVLDHFSRRRAQGQWDFIISDVVFCERFLGVHWRRLFPEEPYLDLKVEPSLLGSSLSVSVFNRSDRALRNATLILALRMTDMHREDYQTLSAERTVPAILPNDEADFGDIEVKLKLFGQEKTTGDIVQHRAILVTDEAISWVDTDQFKLAAMKELRQQRWYQDARKREQVANQSWLEALGQKPAEFEQQLINQSSLKIVHELGRDSVNIEVPAPLALLRPFFTLKRGDKSFSPELNVLDAKHIKLTFKGVENFEAKDLKALPLELHIDGLFGGYKLQWQQGQKLPTLTQ